MASLLKGGRCQDFRIYQLKIGLSVSVYSSIKAKRQYLSCQGEHHRRRLMDFCVHCLFPAAELPVFPLTLGPSPWVGQRPLRLDAAVLHLLLSRMLAKDYAGAATRASVRQGLLVGCAAISLTHSAFRSSFRSDQANMYNSVLRGDFSRHAR